MLKKSASLALIILLFSCQTPNTNVHTDSSKINKSTPQLGVNNFTTKKIQSDDLGLKYTGDWLFSTPKNDPYPIPSASTLDPLTVDNARIDDTENGFVSQASTTFSGLGISGSWNQILDKIIPTKQDNPKLISCTNDGKSMDNMIPFSNTDIHYSPIIDNSTGLYTIAKPKTYNYNGSGVTYSPSGWIPNNKLIGQSDYTYNTNNSNNAYVEISFTGTNIEIFGLKGPDPNNNIKVTVDGRSEKGYDANNDLVDTNNINMYAPNKTTSARAVRIKGLKSVAHILRIESSLISRNPSFQTQFILAPSSPSPTPTYSPSYSPSPTPSANSSNFSFGFAKAIVHASIQYDFRANSIAYRALKNRQGGNVNITVNDNDILDTKIVNLDAPQNSLSYVYYKGFNDSNPKTITIEAIDNNDVTLSDFSVFPSVNGKFIGNNLLLQYVGAPYAGVAYVFIDGVLHDTIDMYQSSSNIYYDKGVNGIKISLNGSDTATHTFEFVVAADKNAELNRFNTNFIGYMANQKLKFDFTTYSFGNTNRASSIQYVPVRDSDKGIAKITLSDGANYNQSYLVDLYSPTKFTTIDYPENAFDVPTNVKYITLEPTYTKDRDSSGFDINVNQFVFHSYSSIANYDGRDIGDVICTP